MKRRYFIIAAIFLFNPVISIFDVFPDFIGYLLIMKAFSNASYVFDNASEAHGAAKQMMLVSLFKLACMIILPFTDATMALVFSFSFAIIELLFGIGAYQKLFDATSFICMRCDEERYVHKSEKLKVFTIIFFLTRVICSTVPDFCALFLSDPQKEWMYRFRLLLLFFFTVISTIVGIVWLIKFISFYKKTLTPSVKEKISLAFEEEMKDRQTVFFSKDFAFAIGVISISMLFAIDIYIDNIEFLSDILLAPVFMSAFIFLVKKGYVIIQKSEKLMIAFLSVHFASSIVNTVLLAIFNSKHLAIDVTYDLEALIMYLPIPIFTVIEAISLFLIVFFVLRLMKKYALERVYENPRFFSEFSVDGFVKEFSESVKKRSRVALVFAGISCGSSILYSIINPYEEAYVVVNIILAVVSFALFLNAMSFINEEVFKRIFKYS